MSDPTEKRSKINEQVATLVYDCRIAVATYGEEEQQQFFEALAIELDNLRTGLKQCEGSRTH